MRNTQKNEKKAREDRKNDQNFAIRQKSLFFTGFGTDFSSFKTIFGL